MANDTAPASPDKKKPRADVAPVPEEVRADVAGKVDVPDPERLARSLAAPASPVIVAPAPDPMAGILARLDEMTMRTVRAEQSALDAQARLADLAKTTAAHLDRLFTRRDADDPQKAIDTTPARQVGQLMLDDRMSEEEILRKVRAIREGKLAPDKATRFRTDARMWPDKGTPLFVKHEGKTIPLRTEVTREDFTPDSLAHHIASGALVPIA